MAPSISTVATTATLEPTIAPTSAVPTDDPNCRNSDSSPMPAPRRPRGIAFWNAIVIDGAANPVPMPTTANDSSTQTSGNMVGTYSSMASPIAWNTAPVRHINRQRPVRLRICPEKNAQNGERTMPGVSSAPAAVALAPSTSCRRSGASRIIVNQTKNVAK